ncbi:MAG: DUF309 domain-containing protein [Candidatus Hydrogenedentes bacterium]|nr:DUF309 domain-containing protein [Candidatus Hydrogenedentota bacterium]
MTKIPDNNVPWPAPWADAPRFGPDLPWPAYAFRPGLPHPRRHAAGHLFGLPEPIAGAPRDGIILHLRSVDLYHAGYFWEAHEGWESLWRVLEGGEALFVQSLIQNSAAQLKLHTGRLAGAVKLSRAAYARVSATVVPHPKLLGLSTKDFAHGILRHYRPLWQGEGRAAGSAPRLSPAGLIRLHQFHDPGSQPT